jgi:hypothetical protein
MDARTAASLDHWLTTPPEEPDVPVPGDAWYPRCSRGHFLPREPERVEGKVEEYRCPGPQDGRVADCGSFVCDGPHDYPLHGWEEAHRTCKRCGEDCVEVMA